MGEEMDMDAVRVWEEIKKNYEIIPMDSLSDDFQSPQELVDYYSSLQEKIIMWKSEDEYIEKIRREIENAKELHNKLELNNFTTEKWMGVKIGDMNIYGRFDILGEEEILDIKTGGEWESDVKQMEFYALIYYMKNYIVPKGKLIYLLNGKIKSLHFTSRSLESLLEDVVEVGNNIKNENFPPNRGDGCRFCPYRSICRF